MAGVCDQRDHTCLRLNVIINVIWSQSRSRAMCRDQSHIPTSYTSSSLPPACPPSPLIIICVEISWRREVVISNTDAADLARPSGTPKPVTPVALV